MFNKSAQSRGIPPPKELLSSLSQGATFEMEYGDLTNSFMSKIIKDPATQAFAFEAALLSAIISNFHRTDAAKLNPCLRSVKEVEDREMLKCICFTANYTMDSVIK